MSTCKWWLWQKKLASQGSILSTCLCYLLNVHTRCVTYIHILVTQLVTRVGFKYFRKYLSQVQVFFSYLQVQVQVLKYLDGIKYTKYFFNQIQIPSTLITNNNTVRLDPKLIYGVTVENFNSIHMACNYNFSIPPVSIPILVLESQLSCISNSGIELTPILFAMAWQRTGDKSLPEPLATRTLSPYGEPFQ